MKNFKILSSILLILTLFSCSDNNDVQQNLYGGKHELRKLNVKSITTQSSSGFYFLVIGSYSSQTTENTIVRFYFLNYRGEYQFMETNLCNVNIKIDNSVTTPYVKFYWRERNDRTMGQYNTIFSYDITKVVLYCKDSDFQPEININDLK